MGFDDSIFVLIYGLNKRNLDFEFILYYKWYYGKLDIYM